MWACLALIGSYFITFGFHKPVISENKLFIASLLSLVAAFSFGSSTVFGKKVMQKVNFGIATFMRFTLTSIIMLVIIGILSMLFQTNRYIGLATIGGRELIILIIIALTTGGTAIFIYYYGLKHVLASKATLYELSFPVTTVVLDYLIRGNMMSLGQWLGAVLIIVSMISITTLKSRSQSIN
jgi:drug/metabolite transporter (DMT)-like permease